MNKRAVLFAVGYAITLIILFALKPAAGTEGTDYLRFVSGFDITWQGEVSHNREIGEISSVTGKRIERGEVIEISHYLTDAGNLLFPALSFITEDCAVSVLLDGRLCYEAGMQAFADGGGGTRMQHLVDLDMEYDEKLLTIRLTATNAKSLPKITAPLFGEHESLTRAFGNPLTASFYGAAFLLLYGLSSLLAIMIFYFRLRRFETQVLASMLSAVCGLWLIGQITLQEATEPLLFLTIPLLYGYLLLLPKKMPKKMPKKVLHLFAISGSGIGLLVCLLQSGGSLRTPFMRILYLILLIIALVTPVMVSLEDIAEHRVFSPSSMQLFGVMSLCLIFFTGTCCRAFAGDGAGREICYAYVMPPLIALYLAAQMYRYTTIIYESRSTHSENEMLYRVAYEDPLTSLYNRAGWDEKMKQLGESKEGYCVISMDLDGLKAINDTKGHQAGDKLIKGFAKALTESFPERFFLSRIGGDEFCVIMEDVPESEVKRCLNRMEQRLIALDRKEKHINHRCSWGYAMKEDESQTAHELYLIADERMYAMKQTHKAAKKADDMTRADSTETKVALMVEQTLKQMQGGVQAAEDKPADAEEKSDAPSTTQSLLSAATAASVGQQRPAPRPAPARTAEQARAALRMPAMTEKKQQSHTLQSIKQQEIARVSKENKVKKALKALEQAQSGEDK